MGCTVSYRLWYPQLDAHHAVQRLGTLLSAWSLPISLERLYIADFYYANPPLLHETHMPAEVRKVFNQLKILRPNRAFLSYPSAPILFYRMEAVQQEAFHKLVGKGLIDLPLLEKGEVALSQKGISLFAEHFQSSFTKEEAQLVRFLVKDFFAIGLEKNDITSIRRHTGLRRSCR